MPRFTTSDGLALHYTDEGTGTPILCLSGLTRNGTDFDFVAPHLTGNRLIRLDYRGRGKSDWADPATYTIPVEARDVTELLDHLGLAKTAILGTSRGGLIAMMLAATARDRLLGVALNDIGPVIDPAGLTAIMGYLGQRPGLTSYSDALAAWPNLLRGFANVSETRMREEIERLFVEKPDGLDITYDPRLRDAVEAASHQPVPDLWPLFEALNGLPCSVIHGVNSDLLTAETVEEMARRHPGLIVAHVPDRGHIPYLDEPQALSALNQWRKALP